MKRRVGLVGYQMGNVQSIFNAFVALGADVFVARSATELRDASHLVLPGVGAFPKGMCQLRELGFDAALHELVQEEGRPFLGVCLGMQLLASSGEEHERSVGLGYIPGHVARLDRPGLRVPHVGWNDTRAPRPNALLSADDPPACYYYVHSYHFLPENPEEVILTCEYGGEVVAGVQRGNVFGVQFHPEKSHSGGLALLRRFTEVASC